MTARSAKKMVGASARVLGVQAPPFFALIHSEMREMFRSSRKPQETTGNPASEKRYAIVPTKAKETGSDNIVASISSNPGNRTQDRA